MIDFFVDIVDVNSWNVELWIEMNVYDPGSFLTVLRQEHLARPELFMAFSPQPK